MGHEILSITRPFLAQELHNIVHLYATPTEQLDVVITSAKEIMFSSAFICLFVC